MRVFSESVRNFSSPWHRRAGVAGDAGGAGRATSKILILRRVLAQIKFNSSLLSLWMRNAAHFLTCTVEFAHLI